MAGLMNRPTSGGLVVPYVVDARRQPIDFRHLQLGHVRKCAEDRRCGICGHQVRGAERLAFIGPNDGRVCFADPWMHLECARLAMRQCPFLQGRDWREIPDGWRELIDVYHGSMSLFTAPNGRAHRDEWGRWHFEALGYLAEVPV
jgi:hypothetical protein